MVEGEEGRLTYRGYSIEDITSPESTFEEIVALLYDGTLPNSDRVNEIQQLFEKERELSDGLIDIASFKHLGFYSSKI